MTTMITVLTKPDCGPCTAVKRWLKKRGHTFTEIDLSADLNAVRSVKELGYTGAPVTIISTDEGDEHFYGFDIPELTRLLGADPVAS